MAAYAQARLAMAGIFRSTTSIMTLGGTVRSRAKYSGLLVKKLTTSTTVRARTANAPHRRYFFAKTIGTNCRSFSICLKCSTQLTAARFLETHFFGVLQFLFNQDAVGTD